MLPAAPVPIEDHHAAGRALSKRLLGYELLGKFVVEKVGFHIGGYGQVMLIESMYQKTLVRGSREPWATRHSAHALGTAGGIYLPAVAALAGG